MLQVVPAGSPEDRKPTLLFVDDEPRVLKSMQALFRRGYEVHTANSSSEALALLERQPVDLIVSDQCMPEMTGVELLSEVRRRFPATERMLLTGYADLSAIEAALNDCEVARYLVKPCPPAALRAAAAEVLGRNVAAATETSRELVADVVMLPAEQVPAAAAPANDPHREDLVVATAAPLAAGVPSATGVVLLSEDEVLATQLTAVARELACSLHTVTDLNELRTRLATGTVAVVVTDLAKEAEPLVALQTAVSGPWPDPVWILAVERSDATRLIELINSGSVHRFLLKPFAAGQCRLWLESAQRCFLARDEKPFADKSATAGFSPRDPGARWRRQWQRLRALLGGS